VEAQTVEVIQTGVGGQPGVEDEFFGVRARPLFPEAREVEGGAVLALFPQVGSGVAEDVGLGVMDQEGQEAFLPTAALGNVVFFHEGVVPVEGDGVEVESEGGTPGQLQAHLRLYFLDPQPGQHFRQEVGQAVGVFCPPGREGLESFAQRAASAA
jgi:hypothetical protein